MQLSNGRLHLRIAFTRRLEQNPKLRLVLNCIVPRVELSISEICAQAANLRSTKAWAIACASVRLPSVVNTTIGCIVLSIPRDEKGVATLSPLTQFALPYFITTLLRWH